MANRPNDRVLRALHLSSELTTATELIALGLNQIASVKWVARQPGGAFNQLAQGVERVLKLSFGLNKQNKGRVVGAQFGSGGSGHGVITLHTRVMENLLAETSSAAPYVHSLLTETLADPHWADILTALDRWAATSGRYRDLDAIRGRPVHGDPPWATWEEAEHRAVTELGGWGNLTDDVFSPGARADDVEHHALVAHHLQELATRPCGNRGKGLRQRAQSAKSPSQSNYRESRRRQIAVYGAIAQLSLWSCETC